MNEEYGIETRTEDTGRRTGVVVLDVKKSGLDRIKKLLHRSSGSPQSANSSSQPTNTPAVSVAPLQSAPESLSSMSLLETVESLDSESSDGAESLSTIVAPEAPLTLEQNPKDIAWAGLKTFAELLSTGATMFSPLKQVVDGIVTCVETFEIMAEGREDYENLKIELNALFRILSGYFGEAIPPVMTPSIT
ncbi:hypothetical protein FRC07_007659 [Ceratobasidium sp. 392]|nr:hypothetical protein FRC07_007659 [Ceratobasidium sp. 392]